jgi:hypothetical protein
MENDIMIFFFPLHYSNCITPLILKEFPIKFTILNYQTEYLEQKNPNSLIYTSFVIVVLSWVSESNTYYIFIFFYLPGTDIKIWHGKTGKVLGNVDTNQLKNNMATISPNGRFIAAAAFTADVKVNISNY